jgi:hypothetical protein
VAHPFFVQRKPCGSELARDEAGTDNIDVVWQDAIAGKPAPTRDSIFLEIALILQPGGPPHAFAHDREVNP